MVGDRYRVEADPACYPDTDVLINIPDIRNAEQLEAFENEAVARRSLDLPRLERLDVADYCALHGVTTRK